MKSYLEGAYLCMRCGASRSAKARALRLTLICAGCNTTSLHALAGVRGADGLRPWMEMEDYREVENAKATRSAGLK